MTLQRVKRDDALLYDAADMAAPSVPVPYGTVVDTQPQANANWFEVTAMRGPPNRTGFMRGRALEEVDQPPEAMPVDPVPFFSEVDRIARRMGVDRDYLAALAWAESQGLTQLGSPAGPMGPFMFTDSTWHAAVASARNVDGRRPDERHLWGQQVEMAAIVALDAGDALGADSVTLGMLYFAHVFGIDAARVLFADMTKPFDATYTAARGAAAFAACQAERAPLLANPGAPIGNVFDALCAKLDAGYLAAAKVLDAQADNIRFFHAEDDDPRWLMVAREEAFRGVYEQRGATNNDRIVEYLRSAGLSASSDEVPWCGAFVTFCMQQGGFGNTVPRDAARAKSWLTWGVAAPEGARVPGMVVVLKPQAQGSSGHVGFLLQDSAGVPPVPGKVRLLAGNQGNPQRVCAVDFDEDQVVKPGGFRMQAGTQLPKPSPAEAAPGQPGRFRSLVGGGFFSAQPTGEVARSIRTNNPGALNLTKWQTLRKGFFGRTEPDAHGNVTTIYLTPEHGVASWFTLLAVRYQLGQRYGLRTLAARYAGANKSPAPYVAAWVRHSQGGLSSDSVIDTASDAQMLVLAKAMFRYEAGVPTPLSDQQILFGIQNERAGTLPD